MTSSDYRKLSALLFDIRRGSRDSFASIYKMYEKKVYFLFCKLLGSKTDASRMTVDLFSYVYIKLAGLSDPADFEKWLYSSLFSRVRSYLQDVNPDVFSDYIDTDSPEGESLDDLLTQDSDKILLYPYGFDVTVDMMKALDSVLTQMPFKLRSVVLEYYFCGFEMTEITAAEDISLIELKNRLLKARTKMEKEEYKYCNLGYNCNGIVVFLPDILSTMSESIVVASDISSKVTARTGVNCTAYSQTSPVANSYDSDYLNDTIQPQPKNSNYMPTSYAIQQAPQKKMSDNISPAVKILMAVVAILIIIGGTVAVVLAVQSGKKNHENGTVSDEKNTTQATTIEITTKPITTERTTRETTTEETTTEETTTEETTTEETTTEETTTKETTTRETTTETTTEAETETVTAENTANDVQQPEPSGDVSVGENVSMIR